MFIVVILLLRVGNAIFNREELLGRTIDQLNLRATLRKIWRYMRAIDEEGTPARNLVEFYRHSVPLSLSRLRVPATIAAGVFVVTFFIGVSVGQIPAWQLPVPPQDELTAADTLSIFTESSLRQVAMMHILLQNGRVLLGTLLLSMFTFGVAALLIIPVTFGVVGYLVSQMFMAGYGPLFVMGTLLPHGIVEIPLLLLAAAISLRLGAVVTRPPKGYTVGHAWLVALADTLKLGLALLLPGLVLAAFVEAFITPQVVLLILGS
jgi:stage II sporulation protein M